MKQIGVKKMPIRRTVFEWANLTSDATGTIKWTTNQSTARYPVTLNAKQQYDIFNGNFGIRINRPAEIRANEFLVIEKIACSPYLGGHVQIVLDGTNYFLNPDRQLWGSYGISGLASPYPIGASSTCNGTDEVVPSMELDPPVYVLPGQQWSAFYTTLDGVTGIDSGGNTAVAVMISYVLYDGLDAMVARKVMEMGLQVKAKNIEWYKREILNLSKEQREVVGQNMDGNIPTYTEAPKTLIG